MELTLARSFCGLCLLTTLLGYEVQAMLKNDGTYDNKKDPCISHEPLESTPAGCIYGPLGKDLELPDCSKVEDQKALRPRLHETLSAINEALKKIEGELDIPENEVVECLNRTVVKSYDTAMRLRLRKALLSEHESPLRTLTVGMGGSSVTAGHDNLYAQAYPFAFQRAAHCAFKAAGIDLVVRNMAIGANQEYVYGICNSAIFGDDVDLVMWEINGMAQGSNPTKELAMRNFFNADLFPNRPSFVYTGEGGVSFRQLWGGMTEACRDQSFEMIASNLHNSPQCKQLPCAKCAELAMAERAKEERDTTGIRKDLFDTYAEWGTAVFNPMKCILRHADKWMFQGTYTLRAGKQIKQAKGWHYGPWGHRMFGHMLAHWYLTLFKEVVHDLEAQIPAAINEESEHHWSRGFLAGLLRASASTTLPKPKFCKSKECTQLTPQCATTYEPRQPKQWPDLQTTVSETPVMKTKLPKNGRRNLMGGTLTREWHPNKYEQHSKKHHTTKSESGSDGDKEGKGQNRKRTGDGDGDTKIKGSDGDKEGKGQNRKRTGDGDGDTKIKGEHVEGPVVVRPGSDDLLGWAALLDPDSAPLMDMRDYCIQSSHCPQELDQRAKRNEFFNFQDVQKVVDSGKWAVAIIEGGNSRGEVQKGWTNQWGWRDRKYVLMGNEKSGPLKLRLPAQQRAEGFIICGGAFCNEKNEKEDGSCDGTRVGIHAGLSVEVDGKAIPTENLTRYKPSAKQCLMVETEMNPGIRSVTLRGNHPSKVVNIAHIVWW